MSNLLKITVQSDSDPCARAVFTWSEDLQDCDVLALGVEDATLDAMIAAKAHEGADFPGHTVTVE